VSSVLRVHGVLGVAAGVLLVAATGCSSKGVPYATPSTAAPASSAAPAPTVSMSALPAASGQLTGTQLTSVLLPQSSFPAGFTLSASGAVSSGDSLTAGPAAYDVSTISCATFVDHLGNTGFGETAMASDTAVSGQNQSYDQVVYQFGSASSASGFVAGIKALAGRCHTFTASDNGESGTFSLTASSAPAVGGHPSLELVQSGKLGGSSLVLDTVFTVSGVDVFAGAAVGLGVAEPVSMAKETIVYNLMKRQQAAAVLG
jgi:hypothetical protein